MILVNSYYFESQDTCKCSKNSVEADYICITEQLAVDAFILVIMKIVKIKINIGKILLEVVG